MTLIEVMLATAIAGLAVTGGAALLAHLNGGAAFIARQSAEDSMVFNAERVALRLLSDAQTASDSAHRFQGNGRMAAYTSLCDVPGGWREACRVSVALDSLRDSTEIVVATDRGDGYTVRTVAGNGSFRYLDLAGRDSAWVREWRPSVALPGAIALVHGSDTTILPLGAAR